MATVDSERNPVEELAEEFATRQRRGEHPTIDEYCQRFPQWSDDIRGLFPALLMMERLGADEDLGHHVQEVLAPGKLSRLGDFRIIREVGRGGMGIVYEAEQVSLGRRVALKLLPKQTLLDSKHQKRFLREAKAAARLHHTNIVPVFGVGQQDGLHYYVMQFIHGLGLDEVLVELQRLREEGPGTGEQGIAVTPVRDVSAVAVAQSLISGRFERTLLVDSDESDQPSAISDEQTENAPAVPPLTTHDSPLAPSDTVVGHLSDTLPGHSEHTSKARSRLVYWQSVARIGLQAAQALHYAHDQDIIHRDVKPGNLLLDTRGSVWVTDFGLAKAADQQDLTNTGDVLGTLRYMAPEQFDGNADARSDVFSLGLTLYELLAHKPAFNERDRHKLIKQVTTSAPPRLHTLDPQIPRDLETIVHKAIDRDPSHRYQTAEELAADLQRYLGDEPIRARWISPVTRFARWCKRNPAVAGLTSTIAILLAAAAIISSIAAVRFENLAEEKSNLATEKGELAASLNVALDDATGEQERAEANLDLALEALDAVYLDAIGEEKLLGEVASQPESDDPRVIPLTPAPLTELEKVLLQRGLNFYDQFAGQNAVTPRAAIQSAQAHYRVGLLQAALGDNETAEQAYLATIERFETLIADDPDNYEHFAGLGMAYTGLARIAATWVDAKDIAGNAERAFSRAIVLQPHDASLYQRRGDVYYELLHDARAGADYEQALELDSDNVQVLLKCSLFHENAPTFPRDIDRSRELAQQAVELAQNDPQCHLRLASVLDKFGSEGIIGPIGKPGVFAVPDPASMLVHYDRAIELAPHSAQGYTARGTFYQKIGHWESAMSDLNRAIEMQPANVRTLTSRAYVFAALDQTENALEDLEAVIDLRPNNAGAHFQIGTLHGGMGDWQRAEEAITRSLEIEPHQSYRYKRRAVAYLHLGRYDEALADLETALTRNPEDTSTLWFAGKTLITAAPAEFREGLFELADRAVSNSPSPGSALADRAGVHTRLGNFDQAEADFVRATELDPECADAWMKWAQFLSGRGLNRDAVEKYTQAIRFAPGIWHYHIERGICNYRLHDFVLAAKDFERVLELYPTQPNARLWLVAAFLGSGQFKNARSNLSTLLTTDNQRHWDHFRHALLCLMFNDEPEYRASCRTMLERLGETEVPLSAHFTAWACALCPDAIDNYEPAVALATHAVEREPDEWRFQNTLGAILYRAGRYDDARERLTELVNSETAARKTSAPPPAYTWYFLAMTHHALGSVDEAATWLDKANSFTTQFLTNEPQPPRWNHKAILELLRDEASSLIGETNGTPEELPPPPPSQRATGSDPEDK